ncbi:riboflavin synthase [Corynebacterium anserum]|uniref:Riboflavin synthase n=1 Tax=Corynebacterium anserum TaxID=2684406 RepID=A0A7G7YNH0_9CORY|nr:riboflavin synthase [Corynebacterium anserum]
MFSVFTGIVETVGTLESIDRGHDCLRLRITAPEIMTDVAHGDSIAVNGVCLTVTDFDREGFIADVMQVTLDYTTLGGLTKGSRVNLERAMVSGARYGGHIVQGHVDGTATLMSRTPSENWEVFRFRLNDATLGKYVAKKGSVALNGTSLTVAEVSDAVSGQESWFEVSLIPTTLKDTMLGDVGVGDTVNVECDVLAKYVERLHS